jgi:spore coat protein A, manganese oxidase
MFRTKYIYCFLLLLLLTAFSNITAQLQNASNHPKYVNPLPVPVQIDATGGGTFNVEMNQGVQWLGLVDINGLPLNTTVWGYGLLGKGVTYPGPTFTASMNEPVYINWYNNLPSSGHLLPVDYSIHLAYPHGLITPADIKAWYEAGNIPTVAHLHGGHTESASDGLPESWFTQGAAVTGDHFVKTNYVYDNDQEAATLWYHDHALGITRLNVYAGLAGFYLLEDNRERKLTVNGVLPKNKHTMEIVIQDRNFTSSGQLTLPFLPSEVGPMFDFEESEWMTWPSPTIAAEFFGNYILVNGAAWPYMEVEPRPYRLRLLNGSDSRFYVLEFGNPQKDFLQIGTDNGLLPNAVSIDRLVIGPGERAELVVDFTGMKNQTLILYNYGPDEPFKGFNNDGTLSDGEGGTLDPADPSSTGQIMQFKVTKKLKVNRGLPIPTVTEGTQLRPSLADLGPSTTTRQLALFEGSDEYGRLQPLLGTLSVGSLTWEDAITENPGLNDVETWEVYNFTADAHPIHLHLVSFQILNREAITEFELEEKPQLQHSGLYGIGATVEEVELSGTPEQPAENEKGWKDTFIVPPGSVGRVKAKFDRPGRYVWHCHILSHEDHEMMRPYHVGPLPLPKPSEVIAAVEDYQLSQNYPNPFNPETIINFSLPENSPVSLKIFDVLGNEIAVLINQDVPKGTHEVKFDASILSSGIYYYTLNAADFSQTRKMILIK